MKYLIEITNNDNNDSAKIEIFNHHNKNVDLIATIYINQNEIQNIFQNSGFNINGHYFEDYDIESTKNNKLHGICKTYHNDNLFSIKCFHEDKQLQIFKNNNNICNYCMGKDFKLIHDMGLTICKNYHKNDEIILQRTYIEGGYTDKIKNYNLFEEINIKNSCPFFIQHYIEQN